MKKTVLLFLTCVLLPIFTFAQIIENVDFISPFHNDVAAIKKDGKWAFIDEKGNLIIDFRSDLATTESNDGNYPMFSDSRCQIVEEKAGISYFGFIDKSGKTVIEPEYLNVYNFNDGKAIALKLDKRVIGKNTALGKDMVDYNYFEVLVNTEGEVNYYLTQEGISVVLDKKYLRATPPITSKYLEDDLYAIQGKNKKWNIIKIEIKK
ncbi:WG repeat-containing protein [Bizionia argentinensis JUB59]|uniref:WG repeat-containing protein n=1 Tax=Bizionia argentinensis JUB59 TaxID=1046627 RepID=G2ECD8_9FLAO|nr:WG repeat-containing protein [Bizionia argentinensis]EGV43943.1 WG repeat-containing protein [Bizionia argentinensis JUB59]